MVRTTSTFLACLGALTLVSVVGLLHPQPSLAADIGTPVAVRVDAEEVDEVDAALAALRAGRLSRHDAVNVLAASAGALDVLIDVLVRGTLRAHVSDRSVGSTRLTAVERAVLVEAIGRLAWHDVRAALMLRQTSAADVPTRLTAMEILAALGRPEDVRAMLDWAQLEGKTVRVAPEVKAALTARLDEFIERRPEALRDLHGVAGTLNRSLLAPFLQGLAETPSAERLVALGDLLGAVPELDVYVLTEIGHMAQRARRVPEAATRRRVRRYLETGNPTLVHEAIAAVGHLCDRDAIPVLIELLDANDRVTAQRAHRALVQITGQQLATAGSDWQEWHAATNEWWQDLGPRRIQLALSGPPGAASLALQELAKLRLHRDELAPTLAECLRRDEVELVLLTCATLGHLGSPASMRPLLDTLSDPNVDVRRAAYLALRRISGEDHGDDPAKWRAAGW